jgi:hypothetical protein
VSRPSSLERLPDDGVENRSAAAVVADALREGILHRRLQGGERLTQDAVAARFSVSQMIVPVAFLAALAAGVPLVTIRSTLRRTSSDARAGNRSA